MPRPMPTLRSLAIALFFLTFAPAAEAAPTPFGHPCSARNGVRFCPTASDAQRVRTYDGVPLDVDVTLPAKGNGPWPTILMLHGYAGSKANFQASSPEGGTSSPLTGASTYEHANDVFYALRGYAAVTLSARGFGRSCGIPTSRADAGCASGYLHFADQRFEIRDNQELLGQLVDERIARADALGVTGISYGGGQSVQLAMLRNRMRMPDGTLVPWRSPKGIPLSISAAFPRWGWSSLVHAAVPNGRSIGRERYSARQVREPVGVVKSSVVTAIPGLGVALGNTAPPGGPPTTGVLDWVTTMQRGEPYGDDFSAILDEIQKFHEGIGIPGNRPAPILMENGWTDDVLPAEQAIRLYREVLRRNSRNDITLLLGDIGHMRASNKPATDRAFNDAAAAFFDRHLKRVKSPGLPPPRSVTVQTQTCPQKAPPAAFTARSLASLAPRRMQVRAAGTQTVTATGGDPTIGPQIDPVSGGGNACVSLPARNDPGTAVARMPVPAGGLTVLGIPEVLATVKTTAKHAQLAARLWDVGPDGRQVLAGRGVARLRPGQDGPLRFALLGTGYTFAAGHTVRLELTGTDAPFFRPSNELFSVQVTNLRAVLPVRANPKRKR